MIRGMFRRAGSAFLFRSCREPKGADPRTHSRFFLAIEGCCCVLLRALYLEPEE